jgi:ubiquitin carboxyl-terminal hydrolase 4/11/15
VVTSAAYLLFYRRRSATPLGSPALQQLVQDFRDPTGGEEDTNSDGESRTESPSGQGKGQRLDGSSLSGSSSALVVAEAGRQARGGDGLAALQHSNRARTAIDDSYDADADGEEDEGIDMGRDDDLPAYGPHPPSYNEYSHIDNTFDIKQATTASWGWSAINTNDNGVEPVGEWHNENGGDAASDQAANGHDDDDEGVYQDERLLEDFGDDLHSTPFGIDSMHQNSPIMEPLLNDFEDVVPQLVTDGIGRSFQGDEGIGASGSALALDLADEDMLFEEPEPPVAEVRIEDSPERGGEEHKKID